VVPHAGYIYSGSTAALAYARVARHAAAYRHVVLLGPTHFAAVHGLVLPEAAALATPLGEVSLWSDAVAAVRGLPQVSSSAAVHRQEHSLEVQLPFLRRVLGSDFDILPFGVGGISPARTAAVLDTIWDDAATLIVVSSDLSHYHPYAQAQAIDAGTIAQVLALDATIGHGQACGATPLNGLLAAARRHGVAPALLGACNSGDTAGDKARVVGYAAFSFV
jgi:AmmeMemoRadiSam system protein B